MDDVLALLPPGFHAVRYDGAKIPDGSHDLTGGANCQRYAYAVLAHFGIDLPPWRSSDLWADTERTCRVTNFEPLDMLLFSRDAEPFGAHVAVYAGAGRALHLAKSVGRPVVWSLAILRRATNTGCWSAASASAALLPSPLEGEGRPDAFSGRSG